MMNIAEIIKEECKKQKVPVSRLEKELGFCNGYVRGLKEKIPVDRAQKIADYLHIPIMRLNPEIELSYQEELPEEETYYLRKEIETYMQEMADRPGMRTLFAASRNLSEDDLQIVNQLVQKLTNK
jgi:hypothetical protein